MPSIRFKEVPPGFAPDEIREQWMGTEIPLATEDELAEDPPSGVGFGSANLDGYQVLRDKAIEALYAAGKKEAADFWESIPMGKYLVFKKEVCELIP